MIDPKLDEVCKFYGIETPENVSFKEFQNEAIKRKRANSIKQEIKKVIEDLITQRNQISSILLTIKVSDGIIDDITSPLRHSIINLGDLLKEIEEHKL